MYRVTSRATTSVDVAGLRQEEETELVAVSRIRVVSIGVDEATVQVTLTPERFVRDGRQAGAPSSEQTAELVVGLDGDVRRVNSVGGVPVGIAGPEAADLGPLLGAPLPAGRVRVGRRWSTPLPVPSVAPSGAASLTPATQGPAGVQTGRVTGLRRVRGFDCAMLQLGARRPLERRRSLNDREVGLIGTEFSNSRIAFAFRRGFPVEIETKAEGRFTVSSGAFSGGSVVIVTDTRLVLLSP